MSIVALSVGAKPLWQMLGVVNPHYSILGQLHFFLAGFLIADFDDVEAYVQRLAELAADQSLLESTRKNAVTKAVDEHGWQAFVQAMGELPGYLDS